ncbi:entericidin A/B family lipoprotein [Govanella unica]|uniref:Entericidin A/B family lipoprotein n=1 Tax=Govanella unica TaxID=2975056 RepID=A0A9X3Z803_9PROT|nr:entericidin A/B family lipoprotein [Govania unica]MDA5194820.1 entericidin A/B family lipoprotein [Govania unica]
MKKLITAILLVPVALTLVACNTVEGVGKDIKSGGKAIERAGKN